MSQNKPIIQDDNSLESENPLEEGSRGVTKESSELLWLVVAQLRELVRWKLARQLSAVGLKPIMPVIDVLDKSGGLVTQGVS